MMSLKKMARGLRSNSLFVLVFFLTSVCSTEYAYSEPVREQKIINGQNASAGAWPWMVALLFKEVSDSTEAHYCGGALIGERHILTAAHCVDDFNPQNIQVQLGDITLPFAKGNRLDIVGYVVHPQYDAFTLSHDLAIIKLKNSVTTTPAQLALPADSALYQPGTNAFTLGWGFKDSVQPILPVVLQQAQIPLVSDDTCLDELGRYFKPSSMLCAGIKASSATSQDGVGVCNGDSGGPLVVSNGSGGWKIVGVVSWGIGGCANNKTRGVFAEVPAHADFVTSFPGIVPYFISTPFLSGLPVAGSTLTCNIGEVGGDPVTSTTYSWYNSGSVIADATSATYTLRAEDEWDSVSCGVELRNANGASNATSETVTVQPAPTPEPTPTPVDSTAPTASVVSFECDQRKCSVVISASDQGSGVAEVSATVKLSYVGACSKPSGCTKSKAKQLRIRQDGFDTWKTSFRFATRRGQKANLTVLVRDFAGNISAQAAVVSKKL